MGKCNSNPCNNQILRCSRLIFKCNNSRAFLKCNSLCNLFMMIATKILLSSILFLMGHKDISLMLARQVKLVLLKEELLVENNLLLLTTTITNQAASAWERMHLNLMSIKRMSITSNSKLKLTMKTTSLLHKLEILQE